MNVLDLLGLPMRVPKGFHAPGAPSRGGRPKTTLTQEQADTRSRKNKAQRAARKRNRR